MRKKKQLNTQGIRKITGKKLKFDGLNTKTIRIIIKMRNTKRRQGIYKRNHKIRRIKRFWGQNSWKNTKINNLMNLNLFSRWNKRFTAILALKLRENMKNVSFTRFFLSKVILGLFLSRAGPITEK